MPREYRHIKDFEKEIEELRKEGYSSREIGIKFGFSYKQMRNYFYRHNVEHKIKFSTCGKFVANYKRKTPQPYWLWGF